MDFGAGQDLTVFFCFFLLVLVFFFCMFCMYVLYVLFCMIVPYVGLYFHKINYKPATAAVRLIRNNKLKHKIYKHIQSTISS